MKRVLVTLDLDVDDDATEESLRQWLEVVLPLRGDTGQIQGVRKVRVVGTDN